MFNSEDSQPEPEPEPETSVCPKGFTPNRYRWQPCVTVCIKHFSLPRYIADPKGTPCSHLVGKGKCSGLPFICLPFQF
ncbi:unnamed protein product [Cunninghamella echinulata]